MDLVLSTTAGTIKNFFEWHLSCEQLGSCPAIKLLKKIPNKFFAKKKSYVSWFEPRIAIHFYFKWCVKTARGVPLVPLAWVESACYYVLVDPEAKKKAEIVTLLAYLARQQRSVRSDRCNIWGRSGYERTHAQYLCPASSFHLRSLWPLS